MKTIQASLLGLLLTVAVHTVSAQGSVPLNEPDYNKPKLFADWPQRILLSSQSIDQLLAAAPGTSVQVSLPDNLVFSGQIVSASKPTETSSRTVVIRSTNRAGAVLTLTRRTLADNRISYIGRILSRAHSDAFLLTEENGAYYLVKKSYFDLINE